MPVSGPTGPWGLRDSLLDQSVFWKGKNLEITGWSSKNLKSAIQINTAGFTKKIGSCCENEFAVISGDGG